MKNQNGITLMALVIIIAILVILSTITINTAFGENGLIENAKKAKGLTQNSIYSENESINKILQEYMEIMSNNEEIENDENLENKVSIWFGDSIMRGYGNTEYDTNYKG